MVDVTDTVFRRMVTSCARPDLFFTEFVSADGFCSVGKERVARGFRHTDEDKPLIAQIWGSTPKTMYQTAKEISTMGFAGIDINMGCPEKSVVKSGGGAGLIKTPEIAKLIIQAVKDGAGSLPVSVKTRIGFTTIITEEWLGFLLLQDLDAIILHGRTKKMESRGPNHWEEIEKVVKMRNAMEVKTLIVGNGDVKNVADAKEKCTQYELDGIMMGRAVFTNMWAFDRSEVPHQPTTKELLDLMERHVRMFTAEWGDKKNYAMLKKFFKIYITGFDGASQVRDTCMKTNSAREALDLLQDLRNTLTKCL